MQPYYETGFELTARDVDFAGRFRPSAVFTRMQEDGEVHAHALGFGREALLARGLIFVLFRAQLRMSSYPVMGERVVHRTWPGQSSRFFCPRYHTFSSPDGAALGAASTLWAVVELESRAMRSPLKAGISMPDTSALTPPLAAPEHVEQLGGPAQLRRHVAAYSDLDVNSHVNNARYIDWICDSLPVGLHSTHALNTLLVNYAKEIRPQTEVSLGVIQSDGQFSFSAQDAQGQRFFEASGSFIPWTDGRRFERRIDR